MKPSPSNDVSIETNELNEPRRRQEHIDDERTYQATNRSRSNISLLLKATSLLSTLLVAVVVVGVGGSGHTKDDHNQMSLRGISRTLQENVDTSNNNNGTCTLEYCQDVFDADDLCPSQSFIKDLPFSVQLLVLIILLLFSALFSGLTLGLMTLDLTGLEIVMAGDDVEAKKYAKDIYPIRKDGNLLLCTLLLGNVAVNSLMSIFSAEIFDGTVGFILSTFLIVIFGEIIPQALCSRYALRIGSATVPLVKIIRCLFWIIAWPLAKALDLALGRELATTYSNGEMIELLKVHVKANIIDQEEANAMTGALTYKNICVKDAMTEIEHTYMLNVDGNLSFDTIGKIFKTGYSRIPIYEISKDNIIGLLFVKDLIFLDPEDCVPIRSFIQIFGRNVHLVWPDDTLGDVLAELKKGKSHLGVVRDVNNQDESQDPHYEVKGIITLEDIVERIIGDSIVDETDAFADRTHNIKVERDDFEWARLRLLDTQIVDEMLTTSEISAITAHLKTNHAKTFGSLSDMQLKGLVSNTHVTTFETATQDLDKELPNELLYEKGVPSNLFTLILSGKATVLAGSENFRSDVSSWSILGSGAFQTTTGWIPDYTAFVSGGPLRCIQIDRDSFVESSHDSVFERRVTEKEINRASFATALIEGDVAGLGETDPSISSSIDGSVTSNRRKTLLARLSQFHSEAAIDNTISEKEEMPSSEQNYTVR